MYTAKNGTFVNKLQQACQFHQVATSLLRSGLLQLVICRLVETTCNKPVEIINVQVCWQLATSLISTQGKLNNIPDQDRNRTCVL